MHILVQADGGVRCIYTEAIDLKTLGDITIRRASHVEPDPAGKWLADLAPVHGPTLGPFQARSEALRAEAAWLLENWFVTG